MVYGNYVNRTALPNSTHSNERLLESTVFDEEKFADMLRFNYSVVNQTLDRIDFQLMFERPEMVSTYLTKDMLQIELLHFNQVFRSAVTLKPLDFGLRKNESVTFKKELHSQISEELLETINEATENMQLVFHVVLSHSGLLALLMQASISSLWTLIRAIQLIVFSTLIQVPMPSHTFAFLGEMMMIAQVDPFDGNQIYAKWFVFQPTDPVNENFHFFKIEDSNFVMNSGSFFIIFASIVATVAI